MPEETIAPSASEETRRAKETNKLVKDIKAGEAWVIAIGILTLIVNIAIGAIYYGQLIEMRKSTDDATAESQISNSTLTELKSGSGAQDTHLLAQQAMKQSTDTKAMLSTAGAQAAAVKLLADRAADQATSTAQEAEAAQQAAAAASKLASQSNQQMVAANALAAQSNKLAEAAQKANENTVIADRPWVSVHAAVSGLEEATGKKKKAAAHAATVTVTAINTGRRPARLTGFSANGSYYSAFPDEPAYTSDHSITAGVIVPGDSSEIQFTIPADAMKQMQSAPAATPAATGPGAMQVAPARYYIYAEIEYVDMLTGAQHSTHASWMLSPKTETTPAGIVMGHSYNDAK